MPIQSILVPVEMGMIKAKKWLKEHKYKITFHGKHVHKTQHYLRFRQMAPRPASEVRYRTIVIDKEKGIKAITEYPKKS